MVLGQYRVVLVDTLWYWVNIERYWLIYDGTGSVWGGTGWMEMEIWLDATIAGRQTNKKER